MSDQYHDIKGSPISLFSLVRKEPEWAESAIRLWRKRAEQAEGRLERARDTLRFYADKENHQLRIGEESYISRDHGVRANQTLKGTGGEK